MAPSHGFLVRGSKENGQNTEMIPQSHDGRQNVVAPGYCPISFFRSQ